MAGAFPWIKPRYFDAVGNPLAGGKIWFYLAGTSTPSTSYTDSSGLVPNPNPVILDANGEADIWLLPGNYKVVLMDASDVVIWSKDNIKPNDGGGGGIVDSDYVFSGYSQLLSGPFGPSTGLMDTLAKIIRITYTAPAISLSGSGSGTIREKGASLASLTLTAAVTKKSNPIGTVRFYRGGTLLDTQTTGGAIPNGGSSSYTYSTAFSDTTSFSSQVDDTLVGSDGPTTVTSNTVTYTFVYPYYYGAGATGLTPAQVATLTKDIIVSTATKTVTFTATAGQKFYFAYPASYGALTSILDVNGFETLPDWTLTNSNITGLDTTAQSYRIYSFNNTVVAGSYQYTFKR